MKKSWLNFICILLCVLIPFIAVISAGFLIPPQFDRTFLGELKDKVDRLYSINEPKIVVIGGSSVPFGISSSLMEEALGMPVVNFGLYATLGTKMMLDLSRGAIKKGDVIIIAPETDPQTYSLFFSAESAWQACDSDFSMLTKMSGKDFSSMLGGFWKFTAQKIKYALSSEHLDPSGVYNRSSFNEYGDISYPRPYNVMTLGYEPNSKIRFSPDIISEDFIAYVNDYIKFAEKRGAVVYFSFSPTNEDAIDENTTLESLGEFSAFIDEKFASKRISDPNSYIYQSGYFYDSNFHLNDAGVILHTATLSADIAAALGKKLLVEFDIPKAPKKPDKPITPQKEFDENEKFFSLTPVVVNGKTVGYTISGLSEEGKTQSALTTPVVYNKLPVISISENAFSQNETLRELTIEKSVTQISNGAFAGAKNLVKIHILQPDPEFLQVDCFVMEPTDGLCRGMNPAARFYVPKEALGNYMSGYFWAKYSDYLSADN